MLFRAVLHQEALAQELLATIYGDLWMMLLAIDFTSDMEQAKAGFKEGWLCLK
jgi:hypothetical protein